MKKYLIAFLCFLSGSVQAANYALVDNSGTVQQVIVWDGVSAYTPPTGLTPELDPNNPPQVGIGWTYINGVFKNQNAGD